MSGCSSNGPLRLRKTGVQDLKVHCHAIQCFYVDFLRSKMAARRLEAAAPASEKQAFAALFFSSPVPSFAIDRCWSISQLPLQSHSSFGRSWALRYDQESENKKTCLPWTMVKNSWNPKQACRAPRIELELPWSGDRSRIAIFRAFRCSCVYFATQYNVHNDNRQAGHLLRALRLDRCTSAIIFPHNKMAKKSLNSVTVHL